MKNKILVTGGLGFVGFNLVRELLKDEKNDITIIDNLSSNSSSWENQLHTKSNRYRIRYIIEDINNINLEKYKHFEFNVIYHLGALARIQPSFNAVIPYYYSNILGTANVCELARRCNAKKIYAASSSAYAGPMQNPYSFTKYTGEETLKMYSELFNVSCVSARFFNVYGERQPISGDYPTVIGIFETQYKNNQALTIVGTGEQRRDFTHVKDICNGLILLSKNEYKGEIYNLGTGTNYSLNEVAKMFSDNIRYVPKRPGEAKTTLADLSKSKDIGYVAKINLKDYVNKFKNEWNEKRD